MKSFRKPNRSAPNFRQLLLESMEPRRVLTSVLSGFALDDYMAPELSEEQIAGIIASRFDGELDDDYELGNFQSEEEAQAALEGLVTDYWQDLFGEEITTELYEEHGGYHRWRYLNGIAFELDVAASTFARASASNDRTNVRIPGIDQADSAEFLGEGLVLVSHADVAQIFDISNEENIEFVSSIPLNGWGNQFVVQGEKLHIFAGTNQFFPILAAPTSNDMVGGVEGVWKNGSTITTYDISDPATPTKLSEVSFDGQFNTIRAIGDQLILGVGKTASMPELRTVALDDNSEELRFETEEEYLERISEALIGHFLPDIIETNEAGELVAKDAGSFEDLHLNIEQDNSRYPVQNSVLLLDASGDKPELIDSEVVIGKWQRFAHVDQDSFYSVHFAEDDTYISEFSFDSEEVLWEARGTVPGRIRDAHAMDEFEGTLRVFTTEGDDVNGQDRQANLFTLQSEDGVLEVVGELIDIASGESQYGAQFDGEYAYVTTGEIEITQQVFIGDPLHVIDLSDPSEPIELSELDIPGVARNLRKVGDSHLVGVGFDVSEDGNIRRQVTLYDVSDSENPTIVENWLGESREGGRWLVHMLLNSEEMNVRFNPENSILTIDGGLANVEVFRVNLESENPVEHLGDISIHQNRRWNTRSFIDGQFLVLHADNELNLYQLDDLERPIDSTRVGNPLMYDHFEIRESGTVIEPLENDDVPDGTVISSVGDSKFNAELAIAEDGQSIVVGISEPFEGGWEQVEYEATLPDGQVYSGKISLRYDFATPVDPPMEYSDATVGLGIEFSDEAGNAVTEAAVGEVFWVTLTADRDGFEDGGVFAAYLDVTFDTSLFSVLTTEHLGPYSNGVSSDLTDEGLRGFGGFASETRGDAGPNAVARFQVEVIAEGDFSFRATSTEPETPEHQFLVYGEDRPVDPANVRAAEGVLANRMPTASEFEETDVNQDGLTTPLDALLITNALNTGAPGFANAAARAEGELTMEQMDVSGDGHLSPADLLIIVNRLNQGRPGGEGEGSFHSAVDSVFASVPNELENESENGASNFRRVQQLAAAQSSLWDLERKRS